MNHFDLELTRMRRPTLLMRAVRFALAEYPRARLLRQLAPGEAEAERIVPRLFAVEEQFEDMRRRKDVTYSPARHIEVLVALVSEVQRYGRQEQPKLATFAPKVVPIRREQRELCLEAVF